MTDECDECGEELTTDEEKMEGKCEDCQEEDDE